MTDENAPLDSLFNEAEENGETPDPAPRRQKKRSRKVLIVVLVILGLLLAVAGSIVWRYAKIASNALEKLERSESVMPGPDVKRPEQPTGKKVPVNVLILGSDSRGRGDHGRSDVMILAHVPSDRKSIYLISFTRDAWVEIPGHGMHKINAAYAYGGAPLAVQTIEGITGAYIDHVALIDFEGFMATIDALGGVEVYNSRPSRGSGFEGHTFPEGKITLNGESALAYVRERKTITDGDLGRAERQRDVIKAIAGKTLSWDVVTNPDKLDNVLQAMVPNFTVDSGLTDEKIRDLVFSMRDVRSGSIYSMQIPIAYYSTSSDGQAIDVIHETYMEDLSKALRTDNMASYYEQHKDDPFILGVR